MKKLFFIIGLFLLSLPSFAQIQAGQQMIDLKLDLGFQLQNSGITYSAYGDRADWGTLGVEAGISYYYFLTDYFGLGGELSYGDFEGGGDLSFSSSNNIDDKTKLFSAMLTGRLNITPQSRVRFYFPFGIGLVAANQDVYIKYSSIEFKNKKTDTSLGLFIGAGLEFDVGQNGWGWGLETRYNTFWYDTEKLVRNSPASIYGDGNRRYEYWTFQLHINKRF